MYFNFLTAGSAEYAEHSMHTALAWAQVPYAHHYNTFYPLLKVHLCTLTFGLMYG